MHMLNAMPSHLSPLSTDSISNQFYQQPNYQQSHHLLAHNTILDKDNNDFVLIKVKFVPFICEKIFFYFFLNGTFYCNFFWPFLIVFLKQPPIVCNITSMNLNLIENCAFTVVTTTTWSFD